jgi:nucleoside-diphosphate-sugar epimerase
MPHTGDSETGWICADLNDAGCVWPKTEIAISLGPLDAFADWLERYPESTLQRAIALSSMSAISKQDSNEAGERALAQRLCEAETRIQRIGASRAIACTLFRPTLIYGAGRDRSLTPIARFAQRWRMLPIPLGADGLRQPVHAADLAQACLAVLENPLTYGKTYALGGGERLRFDHMLLRLREAVPGYVQPLPVPLGVLRLLASCWRGSKLNASTLKRLRDPLVADNTDAARDFGYAPDTFRPRDVLAA